MDLKNICRCCLSEGSKMKNIHVSVIINGKRDVISNIIETCFNVKLPLSDDFPQNICVPCITQLQSAYFMKLKINETSNTITKRIEDIKNEPFADEFEDDNINTDSISEPNSPKITSKKENYGKFYCLQCNLSFNSPPSLKTHYRENHKPVGVLKGSYTCKCCLERFTNLTPAMKHRKRHIIPNSCPWCLGKITDYDTHILSCTKHSEYKASDDREITPCHHCGKSYPREYLVVHLRTHGPDLWNCSVCGKGFKVKGNLATHMKVMHSEERPHKCPYCDQCFKLPGIRNRHVRKHHLKERNKKCVECGKAFFSAMCLQRHMYVHTGEKIHKCQFCDKAYQNRWGLKMHQKSQHCEEVNYC